MWFDPAEIAKSAHDTAATFETSATFEGEMGEKSQVSQKSQATAMQEIVIDSCFYCAHHHRPGIGVRYCGGRADLPPAYGEGHPLRHLPDDLGDSCQAFEMAEAYRR